jgi:hypothetical protein
MGFAKPNMMISETLSHPPQMMTLPQTIDHFTDETSEHPNLNLESLEVMQSMNMVGK